MILHQLKKNDEFFRYQAVFNANVHFFKLSLRFVKCIYIIMAIELPQVHPTFLLSSRFFMTEWLKLSDFKPALKFHR